MSGPAERESVHLPEPALLRPRCSPRTYDSPLSFIPTSPFFPLSQVQRTWGWSCQPALGSNNLRWPRCAAPVSPGLAPRALLNAFTLPALGLGLGPGHHSGHWPLRKGGRAHVPLRSASIQAVLSGSRAGQLRWERSRALGCLSALRSLAAAASRASPCSPGLLLPGVLG